METSVVLIKPEFIEIRNQIWHNLDRFLSFRIGDFARTPGELIRPSRQTMEEHVDHIKEKYPTIYKDVVENFSDKLFCARIYQGPSGLVGAIRKVVGPTDPSKNFHGLRQQYSNDILAQALAENRAVRNGIHASGTPAEGKTEEARFVPYLSKINFILYSQQPYLQTIEAA